MTLGRASSMSSPQASSMPVAEEETHILLIEPAGTPNTGDPPPPLQGGDLSRRALARGRTHGRHPVTAPDQPLRKPPLRKAADPK